MERMLVVDMVGHTRKAIERFKATYKAPQGSHPFFPV